MTPYDKLRRMPQLAQPQMPAPYAAPQGMLLNYISSAGDGAGQGGGQQSGGMDQIGTLLGQYLKKRQGASAADAKAAWEAGGSL